MAVGQKYRVPKKPNLGKIIKKKKKTHPALFSPNGIFFLTHSSQNSLLRDHRACKDTMLQEGLALRSVRHEGSLSQDGPQHRHADACYSGSSGIVDHLTLQGRSTTVAFQKIIPSNIFQKRLEKQSNPRQSNPGKS